MHWLGCKLRPWPIAFAFLVGAPLSFSSASQAADGPNERATAYNICIHQAGVTAANVEYHCGTPPSDASSAIGHSGAPPAICTTPETQLTPIASTHQVPPYPTEALQSRIQGTTTLLVFIGTNGAVTDDRVDQSSGSKILDDAGLSFVKGYWRWNPPTKGCQPYSVSTRVSLNWTIHGAPLETAVFTKAIAATHTVPPYPALSLRIGEQGTTIVEVNITSEGVVDGCKIVTSSGSETLDQAACSHIQRIWRWEPWNPATIIGQPHSAKATVSINWVINKGNGTSSVSSFLVDVLVGIIVHSITH